MLFRAKRCIAPSPVSWLRSAILEFTRLLPIPTEPRSLLEKIAQNSYLNSREEVSWSLPQMFRKNMFTNEIPKFWTKLQKRELPGMWCVFWHGKGIFEFSESHLIESHCFGRRILPSYFYSCPSSKPKLTSDVWPIWVLSVTIDFFGFLV